MGDDPYALAGQAAAALARRTGAPHHDAAVALGSGWADALAAFGPGVDVALD